MATSSDALFSCLLEDLSPYLSSQEFRDLLCEEKVALNHDRGLNRNACTQLANAFYAKYVGVAPGELGEDKAFQKFTAMNNHCAQYKLESVASTSWEDELFGEFKNLLYKLLYPKSDSSFELYEILDEARNGPGSAVGSIGGDSYTKLFSSRTAATRSSLHEYLVYFFRGDHRWVSAMNLRISEFGAPMVVEGSKLSFVPKNREIMRSICSEPSVNMFYQLGLGSILEQRLRSFTGIDFSVQPDKNRELARLGSLGGTFCTIDLASASDTISLSLLKGCLPREFYELLLRLRSPKTSFKGRSMDLHMVSTMGNGFTFPLQTIIFACALLAVYKVYSIPITHPFGVSGNYGVFGDDIVCVREAYRPLCSFLSRLGFFVNESKSFSEGPFRESCGADFYSGVNIRGVYCKTLDTPQDLMVLVNRLNDWTSRTGIPVRATCSYLLTKFRFLPVPMCENDDSGVKVPLSLVTKRKYDARTQAIRYDRWVASPSYLTVDCEVSKIYTPRGEKRRIFNPEGLLLEFLLGGLRGYRIDGRIEHRIGVRRDVVRYTRRRNVISSWDHVPTAMGTKSPSTSARLPLTKAVEVNLSWFTTPRG